MARNRKIVVLVLVAVVLSSTVWWLHRLIKQLENLEQAEQAVPQTMQFIQSGALRSANGPLAHAEDASKTIQRQWAAWPSIRTRERVLTSHLENLRVAYAKRLTLVETTVLKVAQSARSGRLKEAGAVISLALSEGGSADQSIQALNRMVDRLKVQDFKASGEAAQESIKFLSDQVPLSETTKAALPELAAVVEREKSANRATHERIASEVKKLIDSRSSQESASFRPVLKGKAMIWDATKNEVEMAYELLPDNLRASSQEGIVTILSVIRREQIVQGHYSISGQPAYKEKMTISVVYWPEKTSAGTVIVWGGEPRQHRPVTYSPEYGSSVNIKNWVESLPRP
ncbi:MAG: hypothetical protein ACRD9S_12865 [Pyrinomonadaceae bacterium]